MIIHSCSVIKPQMKKLFNAILSSGHYPNSWGNGYIVPIYKKGDSSDPKNYRGITISSCLGKVFSVILNNRIIEYLNENDLLCQEQIGFRKNYCTSDHVLMLKTLIDYYKSKNKKIYSCFVDLSAAFDSIWHDGLIYKLIKMGISKNIVNVLPNMYSKISACVKTNDYLTDTFPCRVGTKQGCSLSPTLFNLFLNDLPPRLKIKQCHPTKLNGKLLGSLLYADDLVILSESEKGLQTALNLLNKYCTTWRLKINTDKTKVMVNSNR